MKKRRIQLYSQARLLEAHGGGRTWDVCAIQAGFSLNDINGDPRFYPADVLKKSAHLFEGLPVMEYRFGPISDHRTDEMVELYSMGPVGNAFGFLKNARWCESRQGIVAQLLVNDDRTDMMALLRTAKEAGASLGFSIDSIGRGTVRTCEGRRAWVVTSLDHIDSLDLVTHPAAGGRVLRLVASTGIMLVTYLKLLALIGSLRKSWLVGFDTGRLTESAAQDQLAQILGKALAVAKAKRTEYRRGTDRYTEAALESSMIEDMISLLDAGDLDGLRTMLEQLAAQAAEAEATETTETTETTEARTTEGGGETEEQRMDEGVRLGLVESSRDRVESVLGGCKLPDVMKQRIRESFNKPDGQHRHDVRRAEVEQAVREQREVLAAINPAHTDVTTLRERISVGTEMRDRWAAAIDGWFAKEPVEAPDGSRNMFVSLHEAHGVITGKAGLRKGQVGRELMLAVACGIPSGPLYEGEMWSSHGQKQALSHFRESQKANLRRCIESRRLSEATNVLSTLGELLGDSITRRLIMQYNLQSLSDWRKIATVEPWPDFRERKFIRTSELEDLEIVAESAPYPEHPLLSDEEATSTPSKRGHTLPLSMEVFANDDLSGLRDLPTKIGTAAARTLGKFLLNANIMSNPLMTYDGVALFDAAHGNLETAALSAAVLEGVIQNMRDQVTFGNGEAIGGVLRPKHLMVPSAIERAAWELLNSEVNVTGDATQPNVPNWFKQFGMELFVNHWAVDPADFTVIADPATAEGLVVGFVDGIEEPQIFVQDAEEIGAMFAADRITFKWRHIYGATVVDHRAFSGGRP